MEEIIDKFFEDPFNKAITGMVLYFGIVCWLETSTNAKLRLKDWFGKNWFQLLLGLLVCVIMIAIDDQIMSDFFEDGKTWPWYIYFCSGIILNVLYQIVPLSKKIAEFIVKKYSPIK